MASPRRLGPGQHPIRTPSRQTETPHLGVGGRINFQGGDLDHLVVTRRGGLVAIDSNWRNQASDTIDMAQAARRVRRAEGLAQSLRKAHAH